MTGFYLYGLTERERTLTSLSVKSDLIQSLSHLRYARLLLPPRRPVRLLLLLPLLVPDVGYDVGHVAGRGRRGRGRNGLRRRRGRTLMDEDSGGGTFPISQILENEQSKSLRDSPLISH